MQIKPTNPIFDNTPTELRDRDQWVCHKNKIPYDPKTDKRAGCNKPLTWSTFQDAQKAYVSGGYSGIGFVFTPDDPYVGIDLDHCVGEEGQILPWTQELVEQLNSYTEFSPSGNGLHIIVKGSKPGPKCRGRYNGGEVEMYSEGRYLTFTGKSLDSPPKPIAERQAELAQLYRVAFSGGVQPESALAVETPPLPRKNERLSDEQIVEMGSKAQNREKFRRLWAGDNTLWTGSERLYPSQSEADLALCDMLVFFVGGDPERIERIFGKSGLCRDKWSKRKDYRQQTIRKAIEAAAEEMGTRSAATNSDRPTALPNVTRADLMIRAVDFVAADLPEREIILDPWLLEQSITMIAGWRGIGKSWAVLSILGAVVKGEPFGPWQVRKTVPCAYLDGEMTPQDTKMRLQALGLEKEGLLFVYSDAHANFQGLPRINLLDLECRAELKQILLAKGIKLWAIDNLGALMPGADENAKQDWDPVNAWLLELRFAGIATILLHHTGKRDDQRGTSAHEDNLDLSLLLRRPSDYRPEDGARFILQFSKKRMHTDDPKLVSDVEFHLKKKPCGRVEWTWHPVEGQKKSEIIRMLDEGIMKQTEIADVLGINKSYVTKIKEEAIKEGLLTKDHKLTEKGCKYLNGE